MPTAESGQREVAAPSRKVLIVLAVFALAGVVFAGVSSYDFIAHLDRQVHAITCSIVPGLGPKDTSGASGCHAVLMSPYSSVLRDLTWGGIPIALPALGVFAFLLFRALDLLLRKRMVRVEKPAFMVAATALAGADVARLRDHLGHADRDLLQGVRRHLRLVAGRVRGRHRGPCLIEPVRARRKRARAVIEPVGLLLRRGLAMVALAACCFTWRSNRPTRIRCCTPRGCAIPRTSTASCWICTAQGQVPAVEVLDPLCPACKALLRALGGERNGRSIADQARALSRSTRSATGWSASRFTPARARSARRCCARAPRAGTVLAWAFANQDDLRARGGSGQAAVYARIKQDFPDLASCVGQPAVRARVNKSLRWIVANSLPVLTPQLFVRNRSCPTRTPTSGSTTCFRVFWRRALVR